MVTLDYGEVSTPSGFALSGASISMHHQMVWFAQGIQHVPDCLQRSNEFLLTGVAT